MNPTRMLWTSILCIFILSLVGCERPTTVQLSVDNLLTFHVHGDGKLVYVTIFSPDYDSKAKTNLDPDLAIWRLEYIGSDSGRPLFWGLEIKYGVVPPEFKQTVPANGAPPEIQKGKKYLAAFETINANSKLGYFVVNEQSVEWTKSPTSPCFDVQNGKQVRAPCTEYMIKNREL